MGKVRLAVVMGFLLLGCSSGKQSRPSTQPPTTVGPTTTTRPGTPGSTAAAATTTTAFPTPTKTYKVGDNADLGSGNTVQVFAFTTSVTPSNQFSRPGAGHVFATADVQGCAGSTPPKTGVLNPFFFSLTTGGARVPASLPVKEPALGVGPAASTCARGFVTFEVPTQDKPSAVAYNNAGSTVEWKL